MSYGSRYFEMDYDDKYFIILSQYKEFDNCWMGVGQKLTGQKLTGEKLTEKLKNRM